MGIREPIKLNPHLTRRPLKKQNSGILAVLNPLHIRTTRGSQWELDAGWWGFDASVMGKEPQVTLPSGHSLDGLHREQLPFVGSTQ